MATIEATARDARPLQAEIPAGYGDPGLQPTALTFPTAGCWEITGRVGVSTLTFTISASSLDTGVLTECSGAWWPRGGGPKKPQPIV